MRPQTLDLFGEVPVQLDELLAWMLAVPGIPPTSSRRFAYYVRGWNVLDKIRAAKLAGTFDELTRPAPIAAPYRLAGALDAATAAAESRRAWAGTAASAPRRPLAANP